MKNTIIFLFCMFLAVPVFAQLDSTIVNEALEDALDLDTGNWNNIIYEEQSPPPGAADPGTVRTYAKDDGLIYSKDDAGVESSAFGGGGGAGDVVGPGSSTDNAIAVYDGITGVLLQDSNAIIDVGGTDGLSGVPMITYAGDFTLTATDSDVSIVTGTGAGDVWTVNTTGLVYDAALGNFGIGTAPDVKLDVAAPDNGGIALADRGDVGIVYIGRKSGGSLNVSSGKISFLQGPAALDNQLGFYTVEDGVGGGERVRINEKGYVGINTTAPLSTLHIKQLSGAEALIDLEATSSNQDVFLRSTASPFTGNIFTFKFKAKDALSNEETYAQFGGSITANADGGEKGYLHFDTMLNGTLAERVRITENGDVGIGTDSPDEKLHVEEVSTATNTIAYPLEISQITSDTPVPGLGVGMKFNLETTPGNEEIGATISAVIKDEGAGTEEIELIYETMTGGVLSQKMVLTGDGNVGIGTTSPSSKLEVDITAADDGYELSFDGGILASVWRIPNPGVTNNTEFGTINNNALVFLSNSTERARITPTGNVGIGVTDPDAKLEVLGSTGIKISFDGSNDTTLVTDTNGDLTITPSGTQVIVEGNLKLTNGNFLVLRNDNIGIHSHNANELDIESIGASGTISLNATNDIIFRDEADDEKMRVETDTGNVVIGGGSARAALTMGDDKLISRDVNAGITASTTQSQGQGALTAGINEIAVVANTDDTVTLITAVAGITQIIINKGVNTLQIFPASGDNLGAGVDVAQELEPNEDVIYVAYDATNWTKVASTEITHAHMADEDNTDEFVINDSGGDFHSYHTNGLVPGDLAGWTFDAGGAGTSFPIASIVDGAASGVDIEVTTTGSHLLATGDIITQTNLANAAYVGFFEVKAIISATQYEVAAVFTATGTGTMDQAATLTANIGSAGQYFIVWDVSGTSVNNETFDFQLMKGIASIFGTKARRKWGIAADFGGVGTSSIVTVADGDKISWAISNEDSSANVTPRNFSMVLVRL